MLDFDNRFKDNYDPNYESVFQRKLSHVPYCFMYLNISLFFDGHWSALSTLQTSPLTWQKLLIKIDFLHRTL